MRLLIVFYISLKQVFNGIFTYPSIIQQRSSSSKQSFDIIVNGVKAGIRKACWSSILQKNISKIDLSSGDVNGRHTTALRGGESVGRKKRKTTNGIYLTDRNGLPLAMSIRVCGNHNDLFNIEKHFEQITNFLHQSGIPLDGLFLNFDAGFDAENLRKKALDLGIIANIAHNIRNSEIHNDHYFDHQLYKERYAIERTNAWLDSFTSILNRLTLQ